MQGPAPTDDDVPAMAAFLDNMPAPPNSHRAADGALSERPAERGNRCSAATAAGCASCHSGPYFTDGEVHDVGLGSDYDVYDGYNTPSLVGIDNRVGYLHHGRAESLDELLTDLHSPEKVSGTRQLTAEEQPTWSSIYARCEGGRAKPAPFPIWPGRPREYRHVCPAWGRRPAPSRRRP